MPVYANAPADRKNDQEESSGFMYGGMRCVLLPMTVSPLDHHFPCRGPGTGTASVLPS
ncbi:MAG: hypothetical protein FD153_1594 [Rhodospirillaceae bacterium]|nr:MAG: hypothetical protein FD153_1594 [Rhodospirillaceae bacterium]